MKLYPELVNFTLYSESIALSCMLLDSRDLKSLLAERAESVVSHVCTDTGLTLPVSRSLVPRRVMWAKRSFATGPL